MNDFIGFNVLSLVSVILACIPLGLLVHGWWTRTKYTRFLIELMAYRSSVQNEFPDPPKPGDKFNEGARKAFSKNVKDLSNKYFGKERPPVPRDPVCRAISKLGVSEVRLPCTICWETDDPAGPDENACCKECGLFCLFWAVQLSHDFRELVVRKTQQQTKKR